VRRTSPGDSHSDPLRLWPRQESLPQSKWKTCFVFEFFREASANFRHRFLTHGGRRPRSITTPEELEKAWQLMEPQLRLIKMRADELGTHLILMNIPDYNLVNPKSTIASIKPLNFDVQDRLKTVCADIGIEYHDALPAMRATFEANGGVATAHDKPLYHDIDRHCTPAGMRVLADVLDKILTPLISQKP
jgi:hypothetical protein